MDHAERMEAGVVSVRDLRIGERRWHIQREGESRLEVDGIEADVSSLGAGAWRVTIDSTAALAWTAVDETGVWVYANGRVFQFTGETEERQSRSRSGGHDLSAPMPATVRAVLVEVGGTVRAGDTVVTLEAMKMELPLRAPRDGTVTAVHCRAGDLVQAGVTLVEIA